MLSLKRFHKLANKFLISMIIRLFDIILSGASLILLTPIFFITSVILKFTGEGKVFYLQERVGKNMNKFKIFKFVTMVENTSKEKRLYTVKNDPRILPFGHFLRITKINELPQLLNIFIGDMSVIGPRPQTEDCFNKFLKNDQKIISKLKPGLSGIGPIIFRNEEEILDINVNEKNFYDHIISPYKGKVESWYYENISLRMYVILIFITLWVVFFPDSKIIWKILDGLPVPPDELKYKLNYPY